MHVVFDLDGVLCDTREAVKRAYKAAGVDMPPNAYGLPWQSWLKDPAKHALKNAKYPLMLEAYGYRLHGCDILNEVEAAGHNVHILTGASEDATRLVLKFCGVDASILRASCTQEDKRAAMSDLADFGVYIDDVLTPVPSDWVLLRYTEHLETRDVLKWTL